MEEDSVRVWFVGEGGDLGGVTMAMALSREALPSPPSNNIVAWN